MKIRITRDVVQYTRIQLTGKDILKLLKRTNKVRITKETQVLFTVPTGGDYSGMTLDLTESDAPTITVSSKSYDLKPRKKNAKSIAHKL